MELVRICKRQEKLSDLAFRKTGSLFSSAAEVGALVGEGPRPDK